MGFSRDMTDMKTLIVEDDACFRSMLKETLESLFPSMVVQEAAEGNEALQMVDTLRPQLIIMDIRLPGMNGLQLTQKIKTSYPDTKVVILTSYDDLAYREAAVRCGANIFLTKDSFHLEQLEALVISFVDKSSP